jgi:hypothetical protein
VGDGLADGTSVGEGDGVAAGGVEAGGLDGGGVCVWHLSVHVGLGVGDGVPPPPG